MNINKIRQNQLRFPELPAGGAIQFQTAFYYIL